MHLDKQSLPRMRAFLPVGPADELIALIERWAGEKGSGVEWTVKRLKAMRQALLFFIDEDIGKSRETLSSSGISYHRDGTPKGPFRYIFRLAKRDAFAAWNAAMVYSQFRFLKIPKSSWDKFRTKVTEVTYAASMEDENVFRRGLEVLQSKFGVRPNTTLVGQILPIYHYPFSPTRRALIGPLEFGREDRGVLDLKGLEPLIKNHLEIFERILGSALSATTSRLSGVSDFCDPGWGEDCTSFSPCYACELRGKYIDGDYIVGSIHCIPEPGYKARTIANPLRLIQKATTPLGDWLFEQLRRLPMDCTFDQEAGRRLVQRELAACNRVSSVDLTSATDSFPRKLSQELLKALVGEPFTTFMDDLARGQWVLPYREFGHFLPAPSLKDVQRIYSGRVTEYWSPGDVIRDDVSTALSYLGELEGTFDERYEIATQYALEHLQPQTVSWSQGQPLGVYPSFAEFALSHHCVLLGLIAELGIPWESYVLLGDDVAIFDDGLARAYQALMARYGVEINPSKGLHSSKLAEFAGHILSATSDIPSYRWHRPGDDNFLDICRGIGSLRARDLLSKRQQAVFDILRIAPEHLGGLGLNPEGIPLLEREEAFKDLQQEYVRPMTYRTPVSTLNTLLYKSRAPENPREPVLPDRARLVQLLVKHGIYVPLEEVPRVLDENPRLGDGLPIALRDAVRLWLVPHTDKTSTPRLDQLEIALGLKGYERQRHWLESRRRLAVAFQGQH